MDESVLLLHEDKNCSGDCECSLNDISSIRNCYPWLHTHDFWEILFVAGGRFINTVNRQTVPCSDGTLIFFRPQDIHRIDPDHDHECHLINLTYKQQVFQDLCVYLGAGFDAEALTEPPIPPHIRLNALQKQDLLAKLYRLNTIPLTDKAQINLTLRYILADLYYQYLCRPALNSQSACPDWLNQLCRDMKYRENFTLGTPALSALSGKSQAYLCRSFRKYLNTTPVDFINDLRLSYAQNLLLNSDRGILDICYETGYNSPGHFYMLFTQRFGIPPLRYRKENWQSYHLYKK